MAFSAGGSTGTRSAFGGRRRFANGNGALSQINVVPLVDVVLVLLIIFMLTAHVMEFGLEIQVPEVKQSRDSAEDLPVINITRDGKLYLGDKSININRISEEVAAKYKNAKSVYVVADKATVWDVIANVVSALNEAKLKINMVTKPQEFSGENAVTPNLRMHADILDEQEPLRQWFLAALALHVTVVGGLALYNWMESHRPAFGAKDAGGGAIGVEAVNAIPLQHSGQQNPVANDTQSQVPQQPAKPIEQAKKEKVNPNAVAIKMREKRRLTDVASERQKYRPFKDMVPNQVFSQQAPQVSNPLYAAMPGSGRIGTGANTTLGTQFGAYSQQIQTLVAQKWRTGDVDSRVTTAPTVIATFDLMRDGSIRNVQLLQQSGISALDYSVRRAIMEASPFPPIPPGYPRDSARVEFDFELKR